MYAHGGECRTPAQLIAVLYNIPRCVYGFTRFLFGDGFRI